MRRSASSTSHSPRNLSPTPGHPRASSLPVPPIVIDSIDDPRLAPYRSLKESNATRDRGLFVVEGLKLVERLMASDYTLESVVATTTRAEEVPAPVPGEVPIYLLSPEAMSLLVGFQYHLGVLSCARRRSSVSLEEWANAQGSRSTLVIAPHLESPDNLGAILRNADVFGIDG